MAWYVSCCYNGYFTALFSNVSMRFVSDLYGVNVRPVAPFGSVSRKPYVDSALIHRCLPDELLFEVFLIIKLRFWS